MMENSLSRTKVNMKGKVPEIEKTLELVRVLQEKQQVGGWVGGWVGMGANTLFLSLLSLFENGSVSVLIHPPSNTHARTHAGRRRNVHPLQPG